MSPFVRIGQATVFGAARRSHLRAVVLPPLLLAAFLVALLACEPAAVPPEAEPGGLTLVPQESGATSTSAPTASPTPPFNQFINDCYMPWFNMFLSPTDNLEDNIWCYSQQLNQYSKWLSELPTAPSLESVQEAWLAVQETVEQEPDVAAAYAKVISCLNDIEGLTVEEELLFPWQDFISAADYEAKMRGTHRGAADQSSPALRPHRDVRRRGLSLLLHPNPRLACRSYASQVR